MIIDDIERIRFTLRLNENIFELIGNEASKKGVTKNSLIIEILWQYFELKKQQNNSGS